MVSVYGAITVSNKENLKNWDSITRIKSCFNIYDFKIIFLFNLRFTVSKITHARENQYIFKKEKMKEKLNFLPYDLHLT